MLAVITGASSGIGKEFALALANRGYDLMIVARRESLLNELKAAIQAKRSDAKVQVVVADLSDQAANEKLVARLQKEKVDLFINNAGYGYFGNFLQQDTARVMNMLYLLTNTLTYFTREIGAQMAAKGGGIVMNISSVGAFVSPFPGNVVYGAAKRYVTDISLSSNYENKKLGNKVRIVSVQPGAISTEWTANALASGPQSGEHDAGGTPADVFVSGVLTKVLDQQKDDVSYGKLAVSTKRMMRVFPRAMRFRFAYKLAKQYGNFK